MWKRLNQYSYFQFHSVYKCYVSYINIFSTSLIPFIKYFLMVYYKPGGSRWEFSWLNENITQQWLRTSLCWQAHCVWTSWSQRSETKTQRSSKPLLCNVRIPSRKLEMDFSWLRIWLSLVWIKFYCKGGHFKILKFILTMKTNLTRPCKLVFGSGWI
jgi:hypothetical protein